MKAGTWILAMVLATPVVGLAQTPVAREENPIERLLAHRTELSLTAEQVQKLEAIQKKYAPQEKDVIAKLEGLRGKPLGEPLRMRDLPAAEREKLQANRDEIQPLMQQLRNSHLAVVSEARGVLTAEQSTKATDYLRQGPGQGRGPGAGWAQAAGRGQAQMRGRGQGMGRVHMNAGPGMQRGGRGMMMHSPGTGQGGRGGRGGW